jgi:hypothetical protein
MRACKMLGKFGVSSSHSFDLSGVCFLAGTFLPLVGGVDSSKQTHFNGLFKIQLPGLL